MLKETRRENKPGESGSSGYGGYGTGTGYGGYGTPAQQNYPAGAQQKQQGPAKQKAVFKVGDRLPNGLILESIGNDFVMLRGGTESVKLKISFSDEESEKRIAEAIKTGVKPQVTIITGAQGGSSGGGSSTTVVTPGGSTQPQGVFQGYGR